ncbi:hypothetical protein FB45DRAFT_750755 [Roridomyces roridus]|uniref:Uncharacterized protein n=1 Tax=Roridomyces roridus TaxID=1738132 RepID=A0AAD7FI31_9AGAR|nr:hypothetical protein FB45DRAFT_750755 [Roridomyces roridus]
MPFAATPDFVPRPIQDKAGQPSRLLSSLFSAPDPESEVELAARPWQPATRNALRALLACLALENCAQNQDKVVLVANIYFRSSLVGGVGGEEIWAASTMRAMKNLGYTVLHGSSLSEIVQMYRIFPDLVKMVIVADWDSFKCYEDEYCVQSDINPSGIPIHKIFSFYFWPFPRHPLGQRWVLAPEPFAIQPDPVAVSNNTYLGYSIEDDCALTPFIPPSSRPDPPRAWVLAKLLRYLSPAADPSWSKADFDAVSEATGITFALGAGLDNGESDPGTREELQGRLPEQSVNEIDVTRPDSRLSKAEFMGKVAQTRVLVGVGSPILSPTPYNALCLGVPFINPIDNWDPENPEDTTKWHGQQNMLSSMKPPFVYNVRKADRPALIAAIFTALSTPIDSYILPRMQMSAVESRLAEIVDTDWKAEADALRAWCDQPCGCLSPCDTRSTSESES